MTTSIPFGQADGRSVTLYSLRNARGTEAKICNYGGIVTSLKAADKNGKLGDVVLGCDTLDGYLKNSSYLGALIGRYGNRIAHGRFDLNGKTYTLATNNGQNHLHGGVQGFDKVVWDAQPLDLPDGPALELTYLSKDGEEGYPGNLNVKAVYTLTDDDMLRVDFTATTDAATPCNLTQHSYFNLAGSGDVLGHEVTIFADRFAPITESLIPTGGLQPVKDTPFDFTKPVTIAARIQQEDEQLKRAGGYDHTFVFDHPAGEFNLVARVTEPASGRVLEVFTTEPGMQFYSGNFLDGSIKGKNGQVYDFRSGFCMEPQHFPDSPNQPQFPSTILQPGQTYRCSIGYKFSVQ